MIQENSTLRPVVGVTGHRNLSHPRERVVQELTKLLETLQPASVITGMAVGFDQVVAEVCLDLGVPYIAAVPFSGQERLWPAHVKERYYKLLDKACRVEIVSAGSYHPSKMHIRNAWIVKNADVVASYHDGGEKGGTASCVKLAVKAEKHKHNLYERCSSTEE